MPNGQKPHQMEMPILSSILIAEDVSTDPDDGRPTLIRANINLVAIELPARFDFFVYCVLGLRQGDGTIRVALDMLPASSAMGVPLKPIRLAEVPLQLGMTNRVEDFWTRVSATLHKAGPYMIVPSIGGVPLSRGVLVTVGVVGPQFSRFAGASN